MDINPYPPDSAMVKVSVIIPYYNRSHTIERCLISVQQQTMTDFECLIVDDRSLKYESEFLTLLVARLQDDRFRIIQMSTNRGGGAARNKGIDNAKGQYIAFLDSDDEWLPQKLQRQLEYSLNEKQPFVSCQSFVHHVGGVGVLPLIQLERQRISEYLFVQSGWLPTPSFFLERKAIGSIRFDESLPRHQDYDLLFQLEQAGIHPTILMEPLVRVHWEDLEVSGRSVNTANSKTFSLSRREYFSKNSYSCFMAKFVLIPTIKSKGRFVAVPLVLKCGVRYFSNANLALEVMSTFLFKDPRLLTYAAKVKNALK